MSRKIFITLMMSLLGLLATKAQVTSTPSPLQEDSKDVVIFFHADQGNKGLAGLPPSAQVYAHTGVLTSDSKSDSDWRYAPSWGDNSAKYKLEYVSDNLWKLYIGDIRTYYGITNPAETIKSLAFVFRTADKIKEGKAEGNKDIFLNVYGAGLQIALEWNFEGTMVSPATASGVVFKAGTTAAADISISVNGRQIGSATDATLLEAKYDFPSHGNYTVKAAAKRGKESVETTTLFCYAPDSPRVDYPGGVPVMGPVRNADGSVTFCIAAPQKTCVMLVGSWDGYSLSAENVMSYQDYEGFRYFWKTISGLDDSGKHIYWFNVDRAMNVADPYARLVLDPDNDKWIPSSVFPDLPAYPIDAVSGTCVAVYAPSLDEYEWEIKDFKGVDKNHLMIYELLLRDFTGTEGKADGNGTLKRAMNHIGYLRRLGVNAVELLPIQEFNGNISWGYNPNFYFAPDKAYGTPADYKQFIDLCHKNGIAVILDVVFNQSDWQHPWYRMYPAGSNPFYNASAPHAYSVLNDWNQGYPLVEKQWEDMVTYWLKEYNVDGFRFDLVKGLGDNTSYANSGDAATNAFNQSRIDRMRRIQLAMEKVRPGAYFINENFATPREENAMAAYGQLNWSQLNNQGCQYAMGYSSDSGMDGFWAPTWERTEFSTVSFLESHDEQRLAYKQAQWGVPGVKGVPAASMRRLGSAAAQMIMTPGAHMIWMFSEMGNAQNTKDSNGGNDTDPKIVDWSLLDDPDHLGLHDSYRDLIHIRNHNADLFGPDATFTTKCAASDWTTGRILTSVLGDKELFTILNPSTTGVLEVKIPFAKTDQAAYSILAKSQDSEPSFNVAGGIVTVPANCFVVIGSTGVSSAEMTVAPKRSLSVAGRDGTIHVAGTDHPVSVFAADGRAVAIESAETTFRVVPGLYIVRSGREAVKVVVR